ncbi:MAG: PD-(D/E)XK nuclease family protein [bacterium]|nr:PD-(D/E)XK nuclease family protein [Acidimicrobiia bacterium]MCY4649106.1 PD-(D/E)XK nuclease family protein [bacterium]
MPPPGASRNVPPLRRWSAIWEFLAAELTGKPPPVPVEERFDPVQAEIVAAQINRVLPLLPVPGRGEFDFDWPQLNYQIGPEELNVFFQFAHRGSDGVLKMYKLKTGQIKEGAEFATAPEEISVVVSDPRFPTSMEAYEMRTADGEVIRLEMPPAQGQETLASLERDYRRMRDSEPRIVAGVHCTTCKVSDLCDTFPALNPEAMEVIPFEKRKASGFRIMISKSRLPEMALCQRRAAWKTMFSIPVDPDHYSLETSPGLELGNRFHKLMAQALLSSDPASFFSEDLEVEALYRQHLALPCVADLSIGKTEFPLGFSVRFGAGQKPVSVVLSGVADGVGREGDGTPAVIDHKTGASPRVYPYEAELYALGTLLRFREAPAVATHFHQLSTSGKTPICDRKVWKREEMEETTRQLINLAQTASQWDLLDATSPPFEVGEWCGTCPFEQRCRSHRGTP